MKLKDLPNIISVLRLLAVAPVAYLLLSEEFGWALVLFAVAGASDGLDGFLAKHYGWTSRLGGILDPLADKALLICCFLVLGWQGLVPIWLVLAVILRDVVIVTGALVYHFRVQAVEAAPIPASKLNTFLQILLLVLVITDAGVLPLPDRLIEMTILACLLTVVVSGAQYVWIWGRKARMQGWKES